MPEDMVENPGKCTFIMLGIGLEISRFSGSRAFCSRGIAQASSVGGKRDIVGATTSGLGFEWR